MVLGLKANPAYDDTSKWLKGTSTVAEPWRRRPTADSNPYHEAGLLKTKRTLPLPPEEKQGDGAFFIVQSPTAEMPQSMQQEPVYEKILAECEDDEDYVPMLLTARQSGNPNFPGLSLRSPMEAETLLSTCATLEPKNQIPMPAEPDEGNSSLLDPNADIIDAERNTTYEGRKNSTGDGEDAPVRSAEASLDHGDYDTPRSRHNLLSSSAIANYLPPDLGSNLMGKITPTSFGRSVKHQVPMNTTQQQVATGESFRHCTQFKTCFLRHTVIFLSQLAKSYTYIIYTTPLQEEPLMSASMSTGMQPNPKSKENEQPVKLYSEKQSPLED